MPKMKRTEVLLSTADGEETENIAYKGDTVEILATAGEWTRVEVANGKSDKGWVPTESVDAGAAGGVSPSGPLVKKNFADLCVQEALTLNNVNPHFLIGVAKFRSNLTATNKGNEIGPFRLTKGDWMTVLDAGFKKRQINDWDMQVPAFGLMVERIVAKLGAEASPVDIYKKQWPNAPADISDKLKTAFDQAAALEAEAEIRVIGAQVAQKITNPKSPTPRPNKNPILRKLTVLNAQRWQNMVITKNRIARIDSVAHQLVAPARKARYQGLSNTTGVPWFIIAVIHEREKSGDVNFSANIAQGWSWKQRSQIEPKNGPFGSFEEAAVEALTNCHPFAAKWADWSTGGALTLLEQYNGLGYHNRGLPSPYIWSFTNQYVKGKYIRDHVFDPNKVDRQLGSAPLLKRMQLLDNSVAV